MPMSMASGFSERRISWPGGAVPARPARCDRVLILGSAVVFMSSNLGWTYFYVKTNLVLDLRSPLDSGHGNGATRAAQAGDQAGHLRYRHPPVRDPWL